MNMKLEILPIPDDAQLLIPPIQYHLEKLEIGDCVTIDYYPNGMTYAYVYDFWKAEAAKFPTRTFVFKAETESYSLGHFRIWRKE